MEKLGNEENMEVVRELMEKSSKEMNDEVNLGDKASNVVAIDYTTSAGKHYKGKVIFKRPNVMETLKMGGRKSQLLKEAGVTDLRLVDPGIAMLATAQAALEIVVVKCPEWLIDMDKIEDPEIVYHVYGQFEVWQYSFRPGGVQSEA